VQAAARDPAIRQKLETLGVDPVGSTPEVFSAFVQAEMTRWSALVKSNRITVD
jgi:tripartite-type tricarboxylate transporter receptor subunit TctC